MVVYTLEERWEVDLRSTCRRCGLWQKKSSFWSTENPHSYIEKPTHSKRVTVWCDFEQIVAVIVNGDRYRAMLNEFLFTKTALRVTQPKLYSMFCALFLKIALSDAELMSFGHLGAAI